MPRFHAGEACCRQLSRQAWADLLPVLTAFSSKDGWAPQAWNSHVNSSMQGASMAAEPGTSTAATAAAATAAAAVSAAAAPESAHVQCAALRPCTTSIALYLIARAVAARVTPIVREMAKQPCS